LNELLVLALRASSGRHSDAARHVLLTIILMQLLAGAAHDAPPHAPRRPSRRGPAPRSRHTYRATITGRRARG
jgi:hypothetical protein